MKYNLINFAYMANNVFLLKDALTIMLLLAKAEC